MRKNGIAIIILLILVVWGVYDYTNNNGQQNKQVSTSGVKVGIAKGNMAPDFNLLSLDEKNVKLSDFTGKKVILNFWGTWCPPCRVEMPHMEKMYNHDGDNVVVLSVNLTQTEKSESDVKAFVEDFGLTFPVVMDTDGDVASTYQISAYPTSYFIDSQGIIREIFKGAINDEMMEKAISKMD
ncbi:TlpA family protein disulfide reductase [Paenibacillus antarcticus]|uniref:Cytochrome C biogenesis protein n=1 Tax=Paenibacillus antarcticus TaxID=253703 RepID=A0A168JSU3_9BACL|nr:TlpA disulfide reductase family protein [Paenibacillus antarcticus]OAB41051.1 cytochrome C biogenesis protein [Paenibacillus antarcticus]